MMQREGHSGLWNPQDNLPENLKDVKELLSKYLFMFSYMKSKDLNKTNFLTCS